MKILVRAALAIVVAGTLAAIPPGAAALPASAATVALPHHSAVLAAAKSAANYYRGTYAHTDVTPKNGWSWATYFQGVDKLYGQAGDQRYVDDAMSWGQSNNWMPVSSGETNPDTVKAGQTYYDLHAINSNASLSPMDSQMANDLANLKTSQYDWSDALFMGLPNWTRWSTRTQNSAYLTKMDALYQWSRDSGGTSSRCAGMSVPQAALYDASQSLWYRDCTFIGKNDVNGKPIFWSRGNGWVIAAMAQVLQTLPAGDPHAAKYASMLKSMAARLIQLQGSDGMWRASLADAALYPASETSGSALITYALAYGVKSGLLDSATYLPAVSKAWNGLTTLALQPSGFVADCQGPGVKPANPYTAKAPRTAASATSSGTVNDDSPPYCVGGFLLAASQIATLSPNLSNGKAVSATSQQTGNEVTRINDGNVTTRWSASGFPQSATIDLGASVTVTNYMLVPYQDRAYQYRVQVSSDKSHWQTVDDRTANTSGGSQLRDLASVTARYVRLTVTGVHNSSTTWVSIQEFAVYGG